MRQWRQPLALHDFSLRKGIKPIESDRAINSNACFLPVEDGDDADDPDLP